MPQNGESTVTTSEPPPVLTLQLQAIAMTSTTTTTTTTTSDTTTSDAAVRAVNKRFEGLLTVRSKAIKGKGAWYWAHLEPILVPHPNTGLPKSVKLKCSLCHSLFSASNPSRTASEHLKRGTCSNFSSHSHTLPSPLPISSVTPHRKRPSPPPYPMLDISYTNNAINNNNDNHNHLMLSGGKDDLSALAMFEDSVKKLKSPNTCPPPSLTKDQSNSSLHLLFDWFYDACSASLSLSAFHHPKFRAFLTQVGLPSNLRTHIYGDRLDARFREAKADSDARIRDALFFQLSSHGWNIASHCYDSDSCCATGQSLVKFVVNLPNGSSVFQKAVFTAGVDNSKYAEEVMWDTVIAVTSGSPVQRCVGILADKFKAKALTNLEMQHRWMVNTCCQLQGLASLIKDFNRDLPLFTLVIQNSLKLAGFINNEPRLRTLFLKCRAQETDCDSAGLIRLPSHKYCDPFKNFGMVFPMLEDILSCARVIQMVVMEDDGFKLVCMEDPAAREVAGMVQNEGFWNDLEAVYSLVKLVRGMVQDVELERPFIGRCLPIWEELRTKVKDWCGKYNIVQGPVDRIIDKRFRKNYHPAWAAAFILDPLYLIKDAGGKYLPPYKCLTREQEKDVDKLLTRLASQEEAHLVLMELMKWRSEGLDPLYAQAVQMKQRDPVTGKMKVANPLSSRLVWETCLSEFKSLGKIAVRLIFLQATSCGFKSNWSFMRKLSTNKHSRLALERAQKMIYIAAHAKLERRDFSSEEEKDAELFASSGSEDGMLTEVYADAPLV